MPKQLISTLFATLAAMILSATAALGQDRVGVLPEMLKPEVAEKLGLSDEQREQVQQLIKMRGMAAIGLGQALREAPRDQQEQLRLEFNAESERLGFELLDEQQQAQLAKYRVEWMGLLSLTDESIARAVNLAPWQQEVVEEWAGKVYANRGDARIRNQAEGALRQQLSDSQWAAWQVQAGLIAASTLGPPIPPPQFEEASENSLASPAAETAPSEEQVDNATLPLDQIYVEMSFNSETWERVIKWLADQGDFALQSDVVIPGTFTYRDRSRKYSLTEAMDVMNAVLLNSGYTLFRQGRMLRIVDFEKDPELSGALINELADYVDEAELAQRGKFEPVKHIFTLERIDPDAIKVEADQLRSMQGTVISLPASRQLLVTDMAGNVRAIAEVIRRAENSGASAVQIFSLKSVGAEEVLSVARPLLGLEAEKNTSDDISLSVNPFGTMIFVKGKADKIQILKDLISKMDVPPSESESTVGQLEKLVLLKHRVVGIDLQLAYEIVSQLLAGSPDVRLAQDGVAKQLVLQARPSEHKLVEEALGELAGEASDFVVIQLKRLDTTLAIAAIKKFFGLTDSAEPSSGAPVIDGDLLARQVWVKGSATQVRQIQQLIDKLEENASSNDILGDTVRLIPLTGASARQTLNQVEQLWQARNGGANPIRVLTPGKMSDSGPGLPQKSFAPQKPAGETTRRPAGSQSLRPQAWNAGDDVPQGKMTNFPQQESAGEDVPANPDPNPAAESDTAATRLTGPGDIVIMEGPGGLIISSEDKVALAQFDSLLRLLADQAAMGGGEPTVVYLKNRTAAAAKELLETILSGSAGSTGGGGGGLLGELAGSVLGGFGGGMFGGMMGGGDVIASGSGIASGDYTITADPFLNALIIKAGPADMNLIEQLLQVIDVPEGPLAVETQGQLAMIPVISQDVNQVLNMIKQLYGERIEGNAASGGGGGGRGGDGGRGGGQPNPAELIAALRGAGGGGRGGRGSTPSKLVEPKIALSADTNTNMLIVMAQPKQIYEIEQLVALIDKAGEAEKEDFGYSSLEGVVSATVFKDSIGRILGPKAQTNTSSTTTNTTPGATN
ncbi:MAG: hypothetical protein KDA45_07060, partial [Planctomycetales bacterium]|nr:hypothetical protein [Planctomycetales bacterium]